MKDKHLFTVKGDNNFKKEKEWTKIRQRNGKKR